MDVGLYESKEEAVKREEVLGQIDQVWKYYFLGGNSVYGKIRMMLFLCNYGDTCLRNYGIMTHISQCMFFFFFRKQLCSLTFVLVVYYS